MNHSRNRIEYPEEAQNYVRQEIKAEGLGWGKRKELCAKLRLRWPQIMVNDNRAYTLISRIADDDAIRDYRGESVQDNDNVAAPLRKQRTKRAEEDVADVWTIRFEGGDKQSLTTKNLPSALDRLSAESLREIISIERRV